MKVEFLYNEVINFLTLHYLFSLSSNERAILLFEGGIIDDESISLSKSQQFNTEIIAIQKISPLIMNSYLEKEVEGITGNKIKIVDRTDDSISGEPCAACNYIVFESADDSFFEICPVCGWQTDVLDVNGYSSLNRSNIKDYRKTDRHKENALMYTDVYKKFNLTS